MFLQNQIFHQRYQPKEIPTEKLGFQVGPYRMDKQSIAREKASRRSANTAKSLDLKNKLLNMNGEPQQADQWHIIGVFGGDGTNRQSNNPSSLNAVERAQEHQVNNSIENLLQNSHRAKTRERGSSRRKGVNNFRFRHQNNSSRQQAQFESSTKRRSSGDEPANIQIRPRHHITADTVSNEGIVGQYQAIKDGTGSQIIMPVQQRDSVYENSKANLKEFAMTNQSSGLMDQDSVGGSADFIHTSTLTRIPTNQKEARPQMAQVLESDPLRKNDIILVQNSSRDSNILDNVVQPNFSIEDPLNIVKQYVQLKQDNKLIQNNKSDVDIMETDFAILQQNEQSCLEIDAVVYEDNQNDGGNNGSSVVVSQSPTDAKKSIPHPPQDFIAENQMHKTTEVKSVPVTNIDFREAKQFRKQRSGVENPRSRVSYKLPSYASCLRAQIRPKNFTALKQYYELLAKDEKQALIQQKHFFRQIDDQLDSRRQQKHVQKINNIARSISENDDNQSIIQNSARGQQLSLMPQRSQLNQNLRKSQQQKQMSNSYQVNEEKEVKQRRNVFVKGRPHQNRQSQDASENEDNMQAIFNRRSNMLYSQQSQRPSQQWTDLRSRSQVQSQKSSVPHVTSIRIGAQKLKHQFAMKGPTLRAELLQNEASVGTFIKEQEGSDQNLLRGDQGILSLKSIQYTNQTASPIKHVHMIRPQHKSSNRFGVQKITDQTINHSSKLLNYNTTNSQNQYRSSIQTQNNQGGNSKTVSKKLEADSHKKRDEGCNKDLNESNSEDHQKNHDVIQDENEDLAQEGHEIMQQINSVGDIEFAIGGRSSANLGQLVRGKTLFDIIKHEDDSMQHLSKGLAIAQSNIFSNKHLGNKNFGQKEEETKNNVAEANSNLQPQFQESQYIQQLDVMSGGIATKKVSINQSDKQMEIAFKTNDVFSSQNDEEYDLIPHMMTSSPEKMINNQYENTTTQVLKSYSPQKQSHLMPPKMQTQIISYQMPKDFELNYQNIKPVDMIQRDNHHNDGQFLNSQAVSTIRQSGPSPTNDQPSAKYQPIPDMTQVVEKIETSQIIRQDTARDIANKSRYHNFKHKNPDQVISEIRRNQLKDSNFCRTHNRKMAKTPDLHKFRPTLAYKQHDVNLHPLHQDSASIKSQAITDVIHNYSQRADQNLQQNQNHQNSMSQLDGGSIYASAKINPKHPAIMVKPSAKSSVNESDMLGLLDMYLNNANFNSGRGANMIPSEVSNNLGGTMTTNPAVKMPFKTKNLNKSMDSSIVVQREQVIHPQEFSMGRLGNHQSTDIALQQQSLFKGTRVMKHRRQNVKSQQVARQRISAGNSLNNTNRNSQLVSSSAQQKSLLLGKKKQQKPHDQQKLSQTTGHQQSSVIQQKQIRTGVEIIDKNPQNFLNVKQLKPIRLGSSTEEDGQVRQKQQQSQLQGSMRDYGTQIQHTTTIVSEENSIMAQDPEIFVDNATIDLQVQRQKQRQQNLQSSIETSNWSKDGEVNSILIAYHVKPSSQLAGVGGYQEHQPQTAVLKDVVIPNAQQQKSISNDEFMSQAFASAGKDTEKIALSCLGDNLMYKMSHKKQQQQSPSPRRVVEVNKLRNNELLSTSELLRKEKNLQTTKNMNVPLQQSFVLDDCGEGSGLPEQQNAVIQLSELDVQSYEGADTYAIISEPVTQRLKSENKSIIRVQNGVSGVLIVGQPKKHIKDQYKTVQTPLENTTIVMQSMGDRNSTDQSNRLNSQTPDFLKVLGGGQELINSLLPLNENEQTQDNVEIQNLTIPTEENLGVQTIYIVNEQSNYRQSPADINVLQKSLLMDQFPSVKITSRESVQGSNHRRNSMDSQLNDGEVYVRENHPMASAIPYYSGENRPRPRTQQMNASVASTYPMAGDIVRPSKEAEIGYQKHQRLSGARKKTMPNRSRGGANAKKITKSSVHKLMGQTTISLQGIQGENSENIMKGKRLSKTGFSVDYTSTQFQIQEEIIKQKQHTNNLQSVGHNLNASREFKNNSISNINHQQRKNLVVPPRIIKNSRKMINEDDQTNYMLNQSPVKVIDSKVDILGTQGQQTMSGQVVTAEYQTLSKTYSREEQPQVQKGMEQKQIHLRATSQSGEIQNEDKSISDPLIKTHHFNQKDSNEQEVTNPQGSGSSFQKIATADLGQVSSLRKLNVDPTQELQATEIQQKTVTVQNQLESKAAPSEISSPSVNYGNIAHPQIVNQIYQELSAPTSDEGFPSLSTKREIPLKTDTAQSIQQTPINEEESRPQPQQVSYVKRDIGITYSQQHVNSSQQLLQQQQDPQPQPSSLENAQEPRKQNKISSKESKKKLIAMEAYQTKHHISPTRPILEQEKKSNGTLQKQRGQHDTEGISSFKSKEMAQIQQITEELQKMGHTEGEDAPAFQSMRLDTVMQDSEMLLNEKTKSFDMRHQFNQQQPDQDYISSEKAEKNNDLIENSMAVVSPGKILQMKKTVTIGPTTATFAKPLSQLISVQTPTTDKNEESERIQKARQKNQMIENLQMIRTVVDHHHKNQRLQNQASNIVVPPSIAQSNVQHSVITKNTNLSSMYAYQPRKPFQVYQPRVSSTSNTFEHQNIKHATVGNPKPHQKQQFYKTNFRQKSNLKLQQHQQQQKNHKFQQNNDITNFFPINNQRARTTEPQKFRNGGQRQHKQHASISSGAGSSISVNDYLPPRPQQSSTVALQIQNQQQLKLYQYDTMMRSAAAEPQTLDAGESLYHDENLVEFNNNNVSATALDSLMIKGLQPAQTQQSQFMLATNVEKFISLRDNRQANYQVSQKKQNYNSDIMPQDYRVRDGRHQGSQADGAHDGISTQTDIDDVRATVNESDLATTAHKFAPQGSTLSGQQYILGNMYQDNRGSPFKGDSNIVMSTLNNNHYQVSNNIASSGYYDKTGQNDDYVKSQRVMDTMLQAENTQDMKVNRNIAMQNNAFISSSYETSFIQNKSLIDQLQPQSLSFGGQDGGSGQSNSGQVSVVLTPMKIVQGGDAIEDEISSNTYKEVIKVQDKGDDEQEI